jgi:hypothetical protein
MRMCPECGSSVKLENMKRHFANVHPGKDPSVGISAKEHREIRKASRVRGPALYRRRSFQAVVAGVLVIVLGFVGLPYVLHGLPSGSNFDVVGYCGGEGSVEHYHPLLVINIQGVQKEVPAEIGISSTETNPSLVCTNGGSHGLHTHDGSGIVHIELPVVPSSAPTLGQFFEIWGQPLSSSSVWSYPGHLTATMYDSDTRSASDFSSNPSRIPLYEPAGGPTANLFSIPQNLIWNGNYGDGQSGGVFSGEIIWLNVTA